MLKFQEAATTKFINEDIPKHVANVEKLFGLYGHNGYAVGSSITWADICVYDLVTNLETNFKVSLNEKYPVLAANKKICEEHASLGAYLKSRK